MAARRNLLVRAFAIAVAIAGAGAAAFQVAALPGGLTALAAAAGIAALVAATDQLTLEVPIGDEVQQFGLTEAVWVAALVLAPHGAPTLGAAAGVVGWQAFRRMSPTKIAFNAGQAALALAAAEAIWRSSGTTFDASEPLGWLLAAGAIAVASVVNATSVSLIIALSERVRVSTVLRGSLRETVLQCVGGISVGLLAAIAWSANPAGLVLVAVPLWLLFLAHREFVAGLVDRERMEDMARTAERIARQRDPLDRLPVVVGSSRLVRLVASLNRVLDQLDASLARERRVMKAAADQLELPVRAITDEFRRWEGDAPLPPGARWRVTERLDHLTGVLDEMRAVAQANVPGALRLVDVPVCQFLDSVAARAQRHFDGRLTVDHPEERAMARLDVHWTERALLHMLHNAATHGRHTSPVELRARHTVGGWRFEVADRSGGVPAGAEEAVFMPFYRMSGAPDRPGLGLAVVRGVAEAHGGSAGVANRPGVGATFWMRVPG